MASPIAVMDFFTPMSLFPNGALKVVKCNYCSWGKDGGVSANTTRLKRHLRVKHPHLVVEDCDHEPGDLPPPKRHMHQPTMESFGDRSFQGWQQKQAEEKLSLFQVLLPSLFLSLSPCLYRPPLAYRSPVWTVLSSKTSLLHFFQAVFYFKCSLPVF